MFKQIFRITFVTLVWKQYKSVILSTLMLFAYLWLVGSVHEDYLVYATEQDDEGLVGRSFLYKWIALVCGVLIYLAYHFFKRSGAKTENGEQPKNRLFRDRNSKKEVVNSFSTNTQFEDDPFAKLRNKEKLRSRAEILVDKEKRR